VVQRDRHAEFQTTLGFDCLEHRPVGDGVSAPAEDRGARGGGIFLGRPEGIVGDATQAQPDYGEKLSGLARVIRGNAVAALENVPLWHERDISHSSVERIIMPDSCILLDYMLVTLTKLVDRLLVYPENMERNLRLTKGLYFSQSVLLELTRRGCERKAAYEAVQRAAMATWQGSVSLQENLAAEPDVAKHLTRAGDRPALLAGYPLRARG
jgi:adenylosuccinate lyase